MFKEFDVVIAKNELQGVQKSTIGTVLIIYESGTGYEMEFVDKPVNTVGILTVNEKDLEKKTE